MEMSDEEYAQREEELKEAFEIRESIINLTDGRKLFDVEEALFMVVTDLYCSHCISESEAIERTAIFTAKIISAIRAFSEEDECNWSVTGTIQ